LLIAEDQPILRRALAALFDSEADIELVGQATNGAEALSQIRAWRPNVALLDIKMPRMSGIEVARAVLQDQLDVKIVMLTTFDTDDLIFDAILAGAIGYLLKDTEEREIVATVKDAARGQSRLSPMIARKVLDDFRRIKKPRAQSSAEEWADPLTDRESAILDQIGSGKSNKEISKALSLAEGTVKNHVSSILSKLHARSRTELAIKAMNQPRPH
jgi:DNA-binding NarL/FixJ family response regulator